MPSKFLVRKFALGVVKTILNKNIAKEFDI